MHRDRALAMHGPQAVGPGVAATDDDDALALGRDRGLVPRPLPDEVRGLQVLHGAVDTRAARDRGRAGPGAAWPRRPGPRRRTRSSSSAAGTTSTSGALAVPRPRSAGRRRSHHVLAPRSLRRRRPRAGAHAHRRGAPELDALGLELGQPAVEDGLLHLELGDPVAQQSTGLLGPLEHHDVVSGARQLLGAGQAGGARSHDGHRLAGRHLGYLRHHPAARRRPARRSRTRSRSMVTGSALMPSTQAPSHGAGHSRPVNSGKLLVACRRSAASAHSPALHQVVPLGDEVAERTALVAEGDAAVHAARPLLAAPTPRGTARTPRASP